MTNCSFNQFKDLVGVHQVIFDSLLNGSTVKDSVKALRHYLSVYNQDFSNFTQDRLEEFAGDLSETVRIGLELFSEFNKSANVIPDFDAQVSKYDPGATIVTDTIKEFLPENLTFRNENIQVEPTEAEIQNSEPSLRMKEDPIRELASTVVTTADNQTIDFRSNVINIGRESIRNKYYIGVQSAFNEMFNETWNNVYNNVVLPFSIGKLSTITDLNNAIINLKNDLFNTLLEPNSPHQNMFRDNFDATAFKEVLNGVRTGYEQFNEGRGLTVADVRTLSLNDAYTTEKNKYNAYVLLTHFDNLINDISSGLVQVHASQAGIELGLSNKYYPRMNDQKARKNFREDDIDMSGMTQLSEFYEDYIGNMRIYDLDGNVTTQRLDPLSVVNTLSKFSTGINLFDPVGTLKNQIQETLKSYFNGTLPVEFNKTDAKILLTLYANTFRGSSNPNTIGRRTNMDTIKSEIGGRGLTKSVIERIHNNTNNDSLLTSFQNFDPSTDKFNLVEMITANMLKLDATSYGEITVDPVTGAMKRTTFLNREVDAQFYMLKSLGIKAALKGKSQLERSLSRATDYTAYTLSQKGYMFSVKTVNGSEIQYNVETGKFLINGKPSDSLDVAFRMPDFNTLLQEESTSNLHKTYPDYFSIIDMFDNFVGQPLSAQNHTLLDMFREMSDYKDGKGKPRYGHLETIIKIAGNYSYLSHVNAEGLNGRYNASLSDVKEYVYKGQKALGVSGFNFDDIWDSKNNTFKIELSKSAHAGFGALKEYSRVLNNYYNTSVKPVAMNSDGNALPTYILGTLINRIHQITNSVKAQGLSPKRTWVDSEGNNKQRSTNQVFRNNLFVANDKLIKAIEINAGIKNKVGETSSASKMTLVELATASIKGNFLSSYLDQSDTAYQTTNFSDKGKHSTVVIDRNSTITFLGEKGILKSKKWKELSVQDLQHAYFNSMNDYYKNTVGNILSDYEEVLTDRFAPLAAAYYENNPYLSILGEDPLTGEVVQPNPELLQNENFKKAYDTYQFLIQSSKSAFPKTESEKIIHINKIIANIPQSVISAAFNKQGVDFIDTLYAEVGVLDNEFKGKTTLNNNLQYYLDNFNESNMNSRLESIEADFIRSLDRMGFSLELRDNSGKEDFNVKRFLYELGNGTQEQRQLINDIKKNFLDQDLGVLKNSYVNAAGKTVLNPILKRYLYEHLLINRNFQLLTVGSSLEHPHKVKPVDTGKKDENGKAIKRAPNSKELDSGRLTSQNKRMVILQASHHPVILNTLKGLGGMTKSVTVIDPKRDVDTAWGLTSSVDVTDGSTFSNPVYIMLFAESLAGEHSGMSVKSIRGELNVKTGVAALLKHAEYSITNTNILRGYSDNTPNKFLTLMQRTMSEDFTTLYGGVSIDYDLTKDFNGNAHSIIQNKNLHFVYNQQLNAQFGNASSVPENGNLIRVAGMTKIGPHTYSFDYENVTEGTNFNVQATINNTYDLWRLFGGERSVEKDENEVGKFEFTTDTVLDGYIPSMKSSEAVKDFVNTVGVKIEDLQNYVGEAKAKEIRSQYKAEHLQNVSPSNKDFMNQLTVIQPLKNALIGQVSFKSAVKTGASNPISMSTFMDSSQKLPINTHKATFYGMQLNAEHEIGEDSKVVEQSQIITALSFVGTSPEHALKAFDAINDYVSGTMVKLLPKITGMKYNDVDKAEIKKVMRRILSRALETRDNMGMANTVVELLKKEISENSSPIFNIPISSPDLYNTVFTTISNFLTAEGIRRNLPGLAAVLKAHNGFMGVRNVYITDPETGAITEEPMTEEDYQRHIENNSDRITKLNYAENLDFDVDLLNTVIELERNEDGDIVKETPIYLSNVPTYLAVKQKMKLNPQNYIIDLEAKRELKATTFGWDVPAGVDGVRRRMNNFDLPMSMLANSGATFKKLGVDLLSLNEKIEIQTLKLAQLQTSGTPQLIEAESNILKLMQQKANNLQLDIAQLQDTFSKLIDLSGVNDVISQLNMKSEIDIEGNVTMRDEILVDPVTDITKINDDQTKLFKNILNKQYRVISEGYTKPSVFDIDFYQNNLDLPVYSNSGSYVSTLAEHIAKYPELTFEQALGKEDIYFKSGNLVSKPGEIMAPSIYKDRLGLSANHTPANVSVDTFYRKLQRLSRPSTELHDLYASVGNGQNTYIVFEGSANHKALVEKHNLTENQNVRIERNPLNENEYNLYNSLGEKGARVPFDKMYVATINNQSKNYIVIPKGAEANIVNLLRSNGGLFNKVIPNMMATDKLLSMSLLVQNGTIRSTPKIARTLEKLRGVMGNAFRQLSIASKKEAAMAGVNLFDYFNSEWALDEIGNYNEKIITLPKGPKRKVLENVVAKLREYNNLYNQYAQSQDPTLITTLTSMIDEFKAMNKGSEVNEREKIINRSKKSLNHFNTILQDLQLKFYEEGSKRDLELAKRQYSSYKVSMNISAARIPGQHFQSFMGQRIVGFTNDEQNIAYVSPMHMLITGEDFDIDKAYLSYYGLDKKDGTMKGWTTAWRDTTPQELEISLTLPLPTNLTIGDQIFVDSLLSLTQQDIDSLAAYKAGDKSVLVFKHAAKALAKVSVMRNKINKFDDAPTTILIHPEIDVEDDGADRLESALSAILEYNNETMLDPEEHDYFESGFANAIVNGIVATGNDLRNTNIQTSPVDFGEFGDLAEKSQKGIVMKQMSFENPLDVYAAQVYAMVGKDVIAIAAAGGLKPYGTIAYNFTHIKNRGVGPKMSLLGNSFDGDNLQENIISSISLDDKYELDNVANYLIQNANAGSIVGKALRETPEKMEAIKQAIVYNLDRINTFKGDSALALSAILSAATDNAKELILGRINAGPDTVGYYLAASILEMPASVIGEVMQSDTVENALKLADRNLFKGGSVSFEQGLQQLKAGSLNIRSYFDIDAAYSIQKSLVDSDFKIGQYSIDEYLTLGLKGNPSPNEITEYLKEVKKNPYAMISSLLNSNLARTAKINYETLVEDVLEATKNVQQLKAPEGTKSGTSVSGPAYTPPSFDESGLGNFDSGFNEFQDMNLDGFNEFQNVDFQDMDFEMMGESIDSFFDNDESFRSVYSKTMPASILLRRYLNDSKTYLKDVDLNVIETIENLEPLKNDLNILGRFASVNQGVKNNFYDLYKYGELIKNYLKENFPVFFEANPSIGIAEIIDKYYNNPEFKLELDSLFKVKGSNEKHKFTSNLNLLELLFNTGHMSAMQNISFKNAEWSDNISLKTRVMQDLADNSGIPLTRKNYGTLQNYVNDVIIIDTLERLGKDNESDVIINAFQGQTVDPSQDAISTQNYEMDIRTIGGRADFLNWFESTVIPTLQRGNTVLSNGLEINLGISDNNFLKSLTIDSKMDRLLGERYHYYNVRMDTNKRSDARSLLLNDILIDDFAALRDVMFNGRPLTDLFFLYNLFIFKGRGSKGAFTNFLSVVSNGYQDDTLMSKYVNRLGWLDNLTDYRGEGSYSIEDLYNKGYARDTTYIPEVYQGPAIKKLYKDNNDKWLSAVYVWNWNSDAKSKDLGSSEGKYNMLNTPKYNERTINITNVRDISDNYQASIGETQLRLTLSKMFNNNFEIKLDENC